MSEHQDIFLAQIGLGGTTYPYKSTCCSPALSIMWTISAGERSMGTLTSEVSGPVLELLTVVMTVLHARTFYPNF